jgi:energy-converting hydrogenase B subunit Q
VAIGAISEADRHNLRGERISVDTMPIVGEEEIAEAVKAVSRLHRAEVLVLAGGLMGGKISEEVKKLRKSGIRVISLSMFGSVPEVSDIVVSDPVMAGTLAVMHISERAKFDIDRVRGRRV